MPNLQDILPGLLSGKYGRLPNTYRFEATRQTSETSEEYVGQVDSASKCWSWKIPENGLTSLNRNGQIIENGQSWPAEFRIATCTPMQLLFPELLGVWGRPSDFDFPISAKYLNENELLIVLQSTHDEALQKSLVVDCGRGIVLRFYDLFVATVITRIVEEAPDSFPEQELKLQANT